MNIQDVGPRPKSIYTSKQMEDYRMRLKKALTQDGLTSEKIIANTDYKTFISKYVEDVIIQKKDANAIMGITHRLSNMVFHVNGKTDDVIPDIVYPIIHEYHGHHLFQTYYFSVKSELELEVKTVQVIPGNRTILLP